MSIFICPVCKKGLTLESNSLKCPENHTFDRSRWGDVFLLRSSKGAHGDSREMVLSRRDFLEKGYYSHLKTKLCDAAAQHLGKRDICYLDAGCGTGYYTKAVSDTLSQEGPVKTAGVDLSRDAVRMCAKAMPSGEFAVASVYDMPFADESFDLITNVFSPMANEEYVRVLKKGGVLLYATPAPRHLFAMKEILYDTPYENEDKTVEYEGLKFVQRFTADRVCTLENEDLKKLFSMTPYFWKSGRESAVRLERIESLSVEFSFYVHVYIKEN